MSDDNREHETVEEEDREGTTRRIEAESVEVQGHVFIPPVNGVIWKLWETIGGSTEWLRDGTVVQTKWREDHEGKRVTFTRRGRWTGEHQPGHSVIWDGGWDAGSTSGPGEREEPVGEADEGHEHDRAGDGSGDRTSRRREDG